ncbi:uncharacterized mitochondrial protein AtMg00810-like [Hevea brasiliensis]|uniref:uncharacterized mitochondrial protein AtMg00810-like n=1 Tax=Hevea brasiliensis TaxID=3981 RepID=UPI000B7957D8|nr:uncharacterized mitochondrial protein AtMg00810-like [Hevea brasiliensis]
MDVLTDIGMTDCKSVAFPLPKGLQLSTDNGDLLDNPDEYKWLIGRLLYVNITRPDISRAIQHLSQFMTVPRKPNWQAALHVLRCLKASPSIGLYFPIVNDFKLTAYYDSDWASCVVTRKSLIGFCIFFGSSLISWKIKKQPTVSKSSAEAEYKAMASTICELSWISYLLHDHQVLVALLVNLKCDNKGASSNSS